MLLVGAARWLGGMKSDTVTSRQFLGEMIKSAAFCTCERGGGTEDEDDCSGG